ncbi:MAG: patatin-like phospholipase family protein, partial [Acidimicrobiales bacterium]
LPRAGWDARDAELIVGTSIGAVTGMLLRAGMDPRDLFAQVRGLPMSRAGTALIERAGGWPTFGTAASPTRWRFGAPASPGLLKLLGAHPRRVRPGLLRAALGPAGLVPTDAIVAAVDRMSGGRWPDAPLWVASADLDTGRRAIFAPPTGSELHSGPVGAWGAGILAPPASLGIAVAASCAMPSFFRPVEVAGRRFVDGGVHSPANTDLLDSTALVGIDAVVALVPMGIGGWPGRAGWDLPGRWVNHRQAWDGLAGARRTGVAVMLVEPRRSELAVMGYDAFALAHGAEVATRAHDHVQAVLGGRPWPACTASGSR